MILRPKALFPTVLLSVAALAGCLGAGANESGPVAVFTVTPLEGGMKFLYDATNSTGKDIMMQWNFGDGSVAEGPPTDPDDKGVSLIEYTYVVTNTKFWVTLVVTDADGKASFDMKQVTIGNGTNSAPVVKLRDAARWVKPDTAVVLDVSKSTDPDDDLFNYEWILGNYSAENTIMDTGYLNESESKPFTFQNEGVYLFHCHPHPWMTSRVIVSSTDNNASAGSAPIDIENFGYSDPALVVQPGTTVTWTNKDPIAHTATLSWFAPGKVVSSSPILSAKLPTGDYQARLVLNDGKGGFTSQTWGLKASTDAPDNPFNKDFNKTPEQANHVPGTPAVYDEPDDAYTANWPGNFSATIAWTDQGDQNEWGLQLLQGTTVLSTCIRDEGVSSCTLYIDLLAAAYKLHVVPPEGANVNSGLTITTSMFQWTVPDFGDSGVLICPPGYDVHGNICMKH